MATVLLLVHLIIALALVCVVLLQKSEGGALGIGGGGGGGFLTGRGTANLLTRVTAGLAAGFFLTSISLTLLARHSAPAGSLFDTPAAGSSGGTAVPGDASKPAEGHGILDKLQPLNRVPNNQ